VPVHADETSRRVPRTGSGCWDPTRSAAILQRDFGIDRADRSLAKGVRLPLSADFYTGYRSPARMEDVDPLWCCAQIRRYFIRANGDHKQPWYWRGH
jgi:Transposase IS66 family